MNLVTKKALWATALGVIVVAAGVIRLIGLWNGLPRYLLGRDETDYYRWTQYFQQHGTLAGSDGEGYPPALLALLIGEQKIVNLFRGEAAQVGDHYLAARLINVMFACGGVLLGGLIGQRLSGSWLGGFVAAGYLAIQPEFVEESRLATAQPPWIVFSLLSLWLLLIAREPLNYRLLMAAFITGAISMLFKYQTAPLLVMPLLIMARHGCRDIRRTAPPFAVITIFLAALLTWLYFGYQATEIVNTPGSATVAIVGRTSLELMSFGNSWHRLLQEMGGAPYAVVLGVGSIASIALWRMKSPHMKFDWEGLGWLAIFIFGFYLLMSFFWDVAMSKWLPVLNILGILWAVAVAAIAYAALALGERLLKAEAPRWITYIAPIGIAAAIAAYFAWPMADRDLVSIQDHIRPNPMTISMDWFYANLPQGARIMAEGNLRYLFYVGSGFSRPPQFHASAASLYSEPISAFQDQGYEYLVADSSVEGYFADPNNAEFLNTAEPVLTLTGSDYANPNLIVFRIPPKQQFVRYLWFGSTHEISFRGFDLSSATLKPGATLDLALYWMSVKPTTANNIVFIHLWNEATNILAASQDNPPNHGNSPTWQWVGDMQFFIDGYQIRISDEAPPGEYSLRIGMYDADTRQRLPIAEVDGTGVGNYVELARVTIQK